MVVALVMLGLIAGLFVAGAVLSGGSERRDNPGSGLYSDELDWGDRD